MGPQHGEGAGIASQPQDGAASQPQLGRFDETIGPQVGATGPQVVQLGAGAGAQVVQVGTIVQGVTQGRQAKSERRPPKSSQDAPVQEAQGAQDAQETSDAAAHGAQS